MYIIYTSEVFRAWLGKLRKHDAKARILARIKRAEAGNFGDVRSLGSGLWEMRIDFGPGYRVYYGQRDVVTYLLVCGGDKSTQRVDILQAKALWRTLRKEDSR